MTSTPEPQKGKNAVFSRLNVTIDALNLAKEIATIAPAKTVFGLVSILLTMVKDTIANEQGYADLALFCARVCNALEQGLKGKQLDELSRSVLGAIEQLTATVVAIQEKITKQSKRKAISRALSSKGDKDNIAAWRQDLNEILQVFNTELAINSHVLIADMHRRPIGGQGDNTGGNRPAQVRSVAVDATDSQHVPLGELPPQPDACFGREELVEQVVELAKSLKSIALIGVGGIGKTSISLTVLHDDRIRERFGDNRRFIRCDQFPASRLHFLARLSKVIGAGVENPEDLTPLQPFLLSQQTFIVLDNAESILDPQGANTQEIYGLVDQLCRLKTLCICITSRITTVPPGCKRPKIQALSMEAARDIFHNAYGDDERSIIIDSLLQRLDFHALSITLLATVASHNAWDFRRLAKEWNAHRAQVLRTDYNQSLAATLELSLASPTFRKLGPKARDLLGVVAFFPQGVGERNLDWLFPTIPDRRNIFDKFCVLSLTYRSNGFVTALAPIRDYLCPRDPQLSPLLCVTRDCYFDRLSVDFCPDTPEFVEARWIVSEDVNVEHLLDVFTSIDKQPGPIWNAVYRFMEHLHSHKPRKTTLEQKIEALLDNHPSKPDCLSGLAQLLHKVGNHDEAKRFLTTALKLRRKRGDGLLVAGALRDLSEVNRTLGLYKEGIEQVKEALEICEQCGDNVHQAHGLIGLAQLFFADKQLDGAEDAASRAIELLPETGQEFLVCQTHQILGLVYHSKGEKKKAIHHLDIALAIASFKWSDELFMVHLTLAKIFFGELNKANAHLNQARSHMGDNVYRLGIVMRFQALIWYAQGRFGDAKSEVWGALEIFKMLGAVGDVEGCRDVLRGIEKAMAIQSTGELS